MKDVRKRVMVIEDDKDIRDTIVYILEEEDYEVIASEDSKILRSIHEHKPDLVLLDIFLPGKLGTEVCTELKQLYQNLPIILFSAHREEGHMYKQFNADAFIGKPFDLTNLVSTIKKHVN